MSDSKLPPKAISAGALYEIRWSELCPWLILVKSLQVSLYPRVFLLACIGMFLTDFGWGTIDSFVDKPVTALKISQSNPSFPNWLDYESPWYANHPLKQSWEILGQHFAAIFASFDHAWRPLLATLACGLWAIVVWGLIGGAIARISALKLARNETLGIRAALKFAVTTFTAIVGAPLLVLAAVAILTIPIAGVGFLIRSDTMLLLVGLAWVFVIIFGALFVVLLLGFWFGWPLMWATIAVEKSDAFDAVSRTYAYVYQRPLQLAFYILFAGALGLIGEGLLYFVIELISYLSDWAISWGASKERMAEILLDSANTDGPESLSTGVRAIGWWKSLLTSFNAAYQVGYLWAAAVGIYLLLRQQVDSTEMDEIAMD